MNESEQEQAIGQIRGKLNRAMGKFSDLLSVEMLSDIEKLLEIVDSQAQKIAEQNQLLENCAISFKESLEQIAEQAKEIERLKAIESELESVKRMSSGVAGYHLNGEIATWDEVGL